MLLYLVLSTCLLTGLLLSTDCGLQASALHSMLNIAKTTANFPDFHTALAEVRSGAAYLGSGLSNLCTRFSSWLKQAYRTGFTATATELRQQGYELYLVTVEGLEPVWKQVQEVSGRVWKDLKPLAVRFQTKIQENFPFLEPGGHSKVPVSQPPPVRGQKKRPPSVVPVFVGVRPEVNGDKTEDKPEVKGDKTGNKPEVKGDKTGNKPEVKGDKTGNKPEEPAQRTERRTGEGGEMKGKKEEKGGGSSDKIQKKRGGDIKR
jgi:hypothetical protein